MRSVPFSWNVRCGIGLQYSRARFEKKFVAYLVLIICEKSKRINIIPNQPCPLRLCEGPFRECLSETRTLVIYYSTQLPLIGVNHCSAHKNCPDHEK